MDIIIQSLGFNAGNSLESFIKEKLGTLKGDRIVRANVTLFLGPAGSTENEYCEIRLEVPGNDHFVKKNSPHFETSVAECVEILSQMLRQSKDRQANVKQVDENIIQDALLNSEEDNDDVELEEVVR